MSPSPATDPLLNCLARVAAHHHVELNYDAILAGLPITANRLDPEQFLRAATRAGFRAKLEKRSLTRLPLEVLPAIVLLDGNRAGVLAETGGELTLHVDDAEISAPAAYLRAHYAGYAIFIQPAAESAAETHGPRLEFDSPAERRRWFWRTMWHFRGYYLQLLPASALVNVLALAMPFFIMIVYDRVVPNHAEETLWVLALGVALIFAFEFLMRVVRGSVLERAGREMDLVLANALYEQIMSISLRALPSSAGSLASRVKAYETVREFFVSATMLAIADLPFALLMIGVVFYIAGPIGWILVFAALLAIGCGALLQIPLRRSVALAAEAGVERQAFISETLNGLESIKACNAEGHLQRKMDRMLRSSSKSGVRSHFFGLLGNSSTTAILHMTTVAVVVAAVYRVHAGDLTMGGMIAAVMLTSRCMAPLAMVAGLMTRLQQALQSLEALNSVMALEREARDGSHYLHRSEHRINYAFDDVCVQYPGQAGFALKDVRLNIRQGEKIALIGRIGSGKSTFLRVLGNLQPPTAGKVLLDGVDLAQYHPAGVRRRIGYLPQDAALFHGTLRDNITLGAPGVADEAIIAAIRFAGLEEFVRRHPDGVHAQVGERGVMLSGGQRRAVVLARCLMRDPDLLLLDEPTANMDPQAEKTFVANLKRESGSGRTLVVATHKNSLLSVVDRIIVLDAGKVAADGPTREILARLQGKNGQPKPKRQEAPLPQR